MPTMCFGADLAGVTVGRKNPCQVTVSGSEAWLSGMGLRWKERSIFDKPKATVSRTQKMRGEKVCGDKSSRIALRILAFTLNSNGKPLKDLSKHREILTDTQKQRCL